jgi:hypothetical protein
MLWIKPIPNSNKALKMKFSNWQRPTTFKIMAIIAVFSVINTFWASGQQDIRVDTLSLPDKKNSIAAEAFHDSTEAHSPHKATFYSAILPGLGQAYNKKYWKIPIVYAFIGATAYAIHLNSKYYIIYKNAYRDFLIRDPGNKSYADVIPPILTIEQVETQHAQWFERALENKREYYRRYRDLSYIIMVGVYVLNMVDASVDAHFYNFDVSDDLSMEIRPVLMEQNPVSGNKMGLQLSLKF